MTPDDPRRIARRIVNEVLRDAAATHADPAVRAVAAAELADRSREAWELLVATATSTVESFRRVIQAVNTAGAVIARVFAQEERST